MLLNQPLLEKSLVLVSKGDPCPPLLVKAPLKAIFSLSCTIFCYLLMFSYFRVCFSSSFLSCLLSSSRPVLIFFLRFASYTSCLALSWLRAVLILISLLAIHFYFSTTSRSAIICCTLWASMYLDRSICTFSALLCIIPFF